MSEPSANAGAITQNEINKRFSLAVTIVGASILMVTLFAVIAISKDANNATTIFNATLPMIGTWVGTILAFYFTGDAFNKASDNMRQLVDKVTPTQTAAPVAVRDVMRPLDKMTKIVMAAGQAEKDFVLRKDIYDKMSESASRMPVLTADGTLGYIIHREPIGKYLLLHEKDAASPLTLADLANDKDIGKTIKAELQAFVGPAATVAEAKAAMEAIRSLPKCQDAFVTEDGTAKGKVIGWLTNNKILEKTRA